MHKLLGATLDARGCRPQHWDGTQAKHLKQGAARALTLADAAVNQLWVRSSGVPGPDNHAPLRGPGAEGLDLGGTGAKHGAHGCGGHDLFGCRYLENCRSW